MRGEQKRPTGGMHGVVRRREGKTSKSMRMFLLAGIASVCAPLEHCSRRCRPRSGEVKRGRSFSSEKVLPDRLRKGLPSLSQWLQFDLIAHAFEASNKLLLHDLSVPL